MHFGGSLAEQFGRSQIGFDGTLRDVRNTLNLIAQRTDARGRRNSGGCNLPYLVVVIRQGFQRESPRISLVGNELLQHPLRHRLTVARLILQRSREGWNALQRSFLSKELADFQIWIDAFLNPPEKF